MTSAMCLSSTAGPAILKLCSFCIAFHLICIKSVLLLSPVVVTSNNAKLVSWVSSADKLADPWKVKVTCCKLVMFKTARCLREDKTAGTAKVPAKLLPRECASCAARIKHIPNINLWRAAQAITPMSLQQTDEFLN